MGMARFGRASPGGDVTISFRPGLRAPVGRLLATGLLFLLPALHAAAANVVEYTYDAAGNITQVRRQSTAGLAITGMDPGSGAVGTSVTILGSGFGPAPGDNVVRFNGVAAAVTASNPGSISTAVPAGATTGRITVTVGASTATSLADFVVVVPGAPTLASFSPASGEAGTQVAVTGTNFDVATGATVVKLNGATATADVASATGLTFTVPGATASGRITATTAAGTGASATDFIVPPPGVTAADIVSAVRLPVDGSPANLMVSTANKHGLLLFDGAAGTFHTIQFSQLAISPTSAVIAYKVIKPDNSVLATGSLGYINRPTIHLPRLPATGTYSVLLGVGSATLNTMARRVADPVITVDGPAAVSALDYAGQTARVVFEAAAGQRIGVGGMGVSISPAGGSNVTFSVFQPDGSSLTAPNTPSCGAATAQNPQGNCDGEFTTAVAGTYTLVGGSAVGTLGNFSVQLSGEITGALAVDTPLDVTLTRVGQDSRHTFTANAGDSLAVDLSGAIPQPQAQNFGVAIYKPDGTYMTSCTAYLPAGAYCELGSVPVAGTYAVFVDPAFGAYGAYKLTLKQGPLLGQADPPSNIATAATSEAARYRFSSTAGQNLTLGVANLAYVGTSASATYLNVYRPDRTQVGSVSCGPTVAGGTCKVTLSNLPVTGTYGVALVPPGGVRFTGNINLSSDLAGSLIAGTPVALSATRLGQNARYTFAGTAGESTSVKVLAVSTVPAGQTLYAKVYRPDGALLTSASATSTTPAFVNLGSLPATGTYTVLLEPGYGATWQAQLSLDPGTSLSVDGAVAALPAGSTGEPLRFRFDGAAGQRIDVGLTGLAYATGSASSSALTIHRPDGTAIATLYCYTSGSGSCDSSYLNLPVTGTYSLVAAPPAATAIAAGSLALSTPLAGTFVIGDPDQTVATTRPGQTARYTFAGTAAQLLRLNWTGTTVSGTASVAMSVLKPDGSTLGSGSFVNGATGGFDIASLPTTGTYAVVFDPAPGVTMTAPTSLVTR